MRVVNQRRLSLRTVTKTIRERLSLNRRILERSFLYRFYVADPLFTSISPSPLMPRTKEFDPEEVLEQAMQLFWEQGFEATSAQDLVDHTGLNRSSLYNTFGSKQELYLKALDHYRRRDADEVECLLDQFGSARSAIRHLLEEGIPMGEKKRGCFLANATVERGHCDEETRERACKSLSRMHDGFRILVEHGQAQGEFSQEQEPEAMAHFLANTYFGMQTMAKLDLPKSVFDDVVQSALRALT